MIVLKATDLELWSKCSALHFDCAAQISELASQCQRLQQTVDNERERWQQKLNDAKEEADQMKEKMQLQLQELKSAHEQVGTICICYLFHFCKG